MDVQQLLLWEEEEEKPQEQCILCIHFDGRREVVSTLDSSHWLSDKSVWSAQFINKGDTRET